MTSGGWLPVPDCTVVTLPFESVTVNVTFNGVSPGLAEDPGPPQVCVNEKFGLLPLWVCVIVVPYS